MNPKTASRIYLVLAVLFGVVGIVQSVRWSISGTIAIYCCWLNFIPGITFLYVYTVRRKLHPKTDHVFAIPLCLFVVAGWAVFTVGVEGMLYVSSKLFEEIAEIVDVKQYPRLRKGFTGVADHFPNTIPIESKRTRMYYHPGFIQQGTTFQLRLTLPAEDISEIEEKYADTALRKYRMGNESDDPDLLALSPWDMSTGPQLERFPATFVAYLLFAESRGSNGSKWNHGESHGVAISKETNEVVFWYDQW